MRVMSRQPAACRVVNGSCILEAASRVSDPNLTGVWFCVLRAAKAHPMNKWLLLLVVGGLAVAGWVNRDTISDWLGHKTAAGEAPPEGATPPPPVTPNPATASVELAKRTYPDLGVQGSAFNIRFVIDYNQKKASDPNFLGRPDWPMVLAAQTATELGGGPLPAGGMAPPYPGGPLGGTASNYRPLPYGPTPTPGMLPGLQGSVLDATPTRSGRSR